MVGEGTKRCYKCKEVKECSDFSVDSHRHDGLRNICRQCASGIDKSRYNANPTRKLAKVKEWDRTHPAQRRDINRRRYAKHPERALARAAVKVAVNKGKLPRAAQCECAICGRTAQQYHHPSYEVTERLTVIPVCSVCHRQIHK